MARIGYDATLRMDSLNGGHLAVAAAVVKLMEPARKCVWYSVAS